MAVELAAAGITGKDDALEASDGYADALPPVFQEKNAPSI